MMTMLNGTESKYKVAEGVFQRVLQINTNTITVTFKKMSDTIWRISNAWVNY